MIYFEGVDAREKYDEFYEQVIRVKNIMILSFAEHAQALLDDYIRKVLKRFETWWTGIRGRYCLAHAGYGGSNSLPGHR